MRYFLITYYNLQNFGPMPVGVKSTELIKTEICKSDTIVDEDNNDITERTIASHFDGKPILFIKELDKRGN